MNSASIDAKLSKLQNIQMTNRAAIVDYVNRLQRLFNELYDTGHTISDMEKCWTLLGGLHKDFAIVEKVGRISDMAFTYAVSQLIVEKSSKDEAEMSKKAMPAQHRGCGGQNSKK